MIRPDNQPSGMRVIRINLSDVPELCDQNSRRIIAAANLPDVSERKQRLIDVWILEWLGTKSHRQLN